MPKSLDEALVIGISSRALFDFEEENKIFEDDSLSPEEREQKYMALQHERLHHPAHPGVGFHLCQKLLQFNEEGQHRTEIVILSRNDPISGSRAFQSAKHHGLNITRGAFTTGEDPWGYLKPFRVSLFLSANPFDVRSALEQSIPAANVSPRKTMEDPHPRELRIAFDGDSVLFSDEAERKYKERNLLADFMEHESAHVERPLPAGPLQPFLMRLHELRSGLPADFPIRIKTALVTARGAPAHERALNTLRSWDVRLNHAIFLDGLPKTEFLQSFHPDFFFDDQLGHITPAAEHLSAGHVPYGVANEPAIDVK